MGKYDIDLDDYTPNSGGYSGEEPKKGVYPGKLVSINEHTANGNESLRWSFEITEGDYKGWRGYVYSNMTTALWKTEEITFAINGGVKKKVSLDPGQEGNREDGQNNKTVKKAKEVRLRVINETYEDERRGKIRNVLPSSDDVTSPASGDDDTAGSKKKKKKGDDPF